MKELYISAVEELIEKYLEKHPDATWNDAYEKVSDRAYNRYRDKFADMVDVARDRAKYDFSQS